MSRKVHEFYQFTNNNALLASMYYLALQSTNGSTMSDFSELMIGEQRCLLIVLVILLVILLFVISFLQFITYIKLSVNMSFKKIRLSLIDVKHVYFILAYTYYNFLTVYLDQT